MRTSIQKILLAEDDKDHYVNFVQAINSISNTIEIMRVDNGYALLTMLETNISPDAIFLDINMPYKGGLEILEEIKEKAFIKKTPIVILSGSFYGLMIKMAYDLGAILFVKKYSRSQDLQQALKKVFENPYFLECKQAPWDDFVVD